MSQSGMSSAQRTSSQGIIHACQTVFVGAKTGHDVWLMPYGPMHAIQDAVCDTLAAMLPSQGCHMIAVTP